MGNGHEGPLQAVLPAAPMAEQVEEHKGFETFYRTEYSSLVHFVSRRRSKAEDDPEELAQESLTRFLRYRYVERLPIDAWRLMLYRIAANLVKERWRRTQVRQTFQRVPLEDLVRAELEPVFDEPGPVEAAVHAQQQAQLTQAVRALPKQCRKVYVLRFVRGMTNVEIAQHCGITCRMVEKHLANSMQQIRQVIGRATAGA